ncbi:TfoX/Sxy family DNA transformation protein [Vibrio sp. BS-M-Sm-2]|uniref:TfoX/Sxy family DNA transformation protein n=1 Tax=Vibrio sp. BS-M-Sm-2 TaxID=3241167 RepID=UPI0035567438
MKAGIHSSEKLREFGSIKAIKAIMHHTHHKPTIELLCSLEGAIQGVHRSMLTTEVRNALKTQYFNL